MLITSAAMHRSLLGAGLKSIGMVARVNDIPQESRQLRRDIATRELWVVGLIFGASLALEALFTRMRPGVRNNLFVQFVPQAIAYGVAEWLSRKFIPVKETFKQALADEDDDGEFSRGNFSSLPAFTAKDETPACLSYSENPFKPQAVLQQTAPYWVPYASQPAGMRAFY